MLIIKPAVDELTISLSMRTHHAVLTSQIHKMLPENELCQFISFEHTNSKHLRGKC